LFLNRISGNVFVDVGSAFEDPRTAKFRTGVGAELWLDATIGYVARVALRLGYARGLATGGLDKVYFVIASQY
jgi:outer membrane translocation and assembly module TamA